MQRRRGDAELAQCGDLIVHQRDQRRNHDRGAGAAQGGKLVAQALAAAGRHQHQRVAAGHDVPHRRLLQAAEGREAEDAAQNLGRVGAGAHRLQPPMVIVVRRLSTLPPTGCTEPRAPCTMRSAATPSRTSPSATTCARVCER